MTHEASHSYDPSLYAKEIAAADAHHALVAADKAAAARFGEVLDGYAAGKVAERDTQVEQTQASALELAALAAGAKAHELETYDWSRLREVSGQLPESVKAAAFGTGESMQARESVHSGAQSKLDKLEAQLETRRVRAEKLGAPDTGIERLEERISRLKRSLTNNLATEQRKIERSKGKISDAIHEAYPEYDETKEDPRLIDVDPMDFWGVSTSDKPSKPKATPSNPSPKEEPTPPADNETPVGDGGTADTDKPEKPAEAQDDAPAPAVKEPTAEDGDKQDDTPETPPVTPDDLAKLIEELKEATDWSDLVRLDGEVQSGFYALDEESRSKLGDAWNDAHNQITAKLMAERAQQAPEPLVPEAPSNDADAPAIEDDPLAPADSEQSPVDPPDADEAPPEEPEASVFPWDAPEVPGRIREPDPERDLYKLFDELRNNPEDTFGAPFILGDIERILQDTTNGLSDAAREEFRQLLALADATPAPEENDSPWAAPSPDDDDFEARFTQALRGDVGHGMPEAPEHADDPQDADAEWRPGADDETGGDELPAGSFDDREAPANSEDEFVPSPELAARLEDIKLHQPGTDAEAAPAEQRQASRKRGGRIARAFGFVPGALGLDFRRPGIREGNPAPRAAAPTAPPAPAEPASPPIAPVVPIAPAERQTPAAPRTPRPENSSQEEAEDIVVTPEQAWEQVGTAVTGLRSALSEIGDDTEQFVAFMTEGDDESGQSQYEQLKAHVDNMLGRLDRSTEDGRAAYAIAVSAFAEAEKRLRDLQAEDDEA